jgi:hypothetical protein
MQKHFSGVRGKRLNTGAAAFGNSLGPFCALLQIPSAECAPVSARAVPLQSKRKFPLIHCFCVEFYR